MKIDKIIKCPHCREEDLYVFHDNTDVIQCHHCEGYFDIEIEIEVVVKSSVPLRVCRKCKTEFIANGGYFEDTCPTCNHKGYHYRKSDFN